MVTVLIIFNRFEALKKDTIGFPLIRLMTFTEDIHFYCNSFKLRSQVKYSLLDERAIQFYQFIQQSSGCSLIYTKFLVFFITAKINREGWLLLIQNIFDIIILISLSVNIFVNTLNKYFDFSRVFQDQLDLQFNKKEFGIQFLLSCLNFVVFMQMIKQNCKIDWFSFFYIFVLIQIIISCRYHLKERLSTFTQNPLIEKFVYHFDIDGQIFINDHKSVGYVVLLKTGKHSLIQKTVLLLCYAIMLKDTKKISYLQWSILILGVTAALISLIRVLIQESKKYQEVQQSEGIFEIDCLSQLNESNEIFENYIQQKINPQFYKIYFYVQLEPQNESEIIHCLFNQFKGAQIISKSFSRQYIAGKENLVIIRMDSIYNTSQIQEDILSLQQKQQQQLKKKISIVQINKTDHSFIQFEQLFRNQGQDNQIILLQTESKQRLFQNNQQQKYDELICKLYQVFMQSIAYQENISPLLTYNPQFIFFDLFDNN
ncbi:transmembrane protein, putative (macronuclear) [Tetrahymena thermophila SB210]|uniref:Transmembrane protein, putative n=1 Tax=Tetrahymena thermophila (strain SB210) TaxID=312017 RepID=W7XD79_TETTS|nr:transmembrane protein, putative [Tetrahymena thermophila SB210]EWS75457.1 transmembrane protein, putative [Tetrahymena thermophila SB210]|eukprot:XP_012652004.1 transmembrane protein, putative [Tetrahymena thermophila SB210]